MEGLLCSKSLPPGFRFHPTDEELFMYYLKRKVLGKKLSPEMIAVVDVYQYAPWELPPMASLKSRDLNWYFFCPRSRKYPNGGRANRATVYGYWKSTGNDRTMMYNSRPVGKIKTLIFHRGKSPKGERTDWVMHEYRLEDKVLAEKGVLQDLYVICKIYEKSGLGPKNGENYGARFVEEEWDSDFDDDDNRNVQERGPELVPVETGLGRVGDSPDGSISGLTSDVASPNGNQSVYFPTEFAAFGDANVIIPNISRSFVGAPVNASGQERDSEFGAVDMGLGRVGGNPDGSISGLTSIVASPNIAQPVYFLTDGAAFSNANVIVPNTPVNAFVGTPVNASVGNPNIAVADSSVSSQDEVNRMLSDFTEELDNDFFNDFFNDLGDLGIPSGQLDLDWSDIIEMNDLK